MTRPELYIVPDEGRRLALLVLHRSRSWRGVTCGHRDPLGVPPSDDTKDEYLARARRAKRVGFFEKISAATECVWCVARFA